ncbi:hypothetical protein [Sphingomonas sp.]|uniref:hypothetical protein n=1 Tax=Sphingomonas sp. TaxID=28214 RepID=UPI0035C8782A
MSEAGYVHIHRSLLGHPAFRNDGEAMAFAWMVVRAAWRPVRVRYKGQAIGLERGQLAVSVRDLAEVLDRPKGWVERLLTRLKSETMVETRSGTGVTIITICNYNDFQAEQDSGRTARETTCGTDAGQRQDTEQRREEVKKKEVKQERSFPEPARASEPPLTVLEQRCRSLASTIGLTRPLADADRRQLRQWLDDGLDFDHHVLIPAQSVTAREHARGRAINGFRYLDPAIREYAAEWHAERSRYQQAANG